MSGDTEAESGGLTGAVGNDCGVQVAVFALEVLGLESSERAANAQIQFLSVIKITSCWKFKASFNSEFEMLVEFNSLT